MTARQGSWDLVGHSDDPVPASEYAVDVVAREMGSRADAAREVEDVLKSLTAPDGWRGKAEAFGTKVEEVLDNLEQLVDRCDAVPEALSPWGDDRFAGFKSWVRGHTDLIDAIVKVLAVIAVVLAAVVLVAIVFFTAPLWLIVLAVSVAALILVGAFILAVSDTVSLGAEGVTNLLTDLPWSARP